MEARACDVPGKSLLLSYILAQENNAVSIKRPKDLVAMLSQPLATQNSIQGTPTVGHFGVI